MHFYYWVISCPSFFSFLLQIEVPPPMAGDTLLEGVATTQPLIVSGVKKGLPSGEVAGEA